MPNINYKDTSLATRYLQAFLQTEEDSTLRASGVYDEYTHNALITYMELPEVLDANTVYEKLVLKYPNIPQYFKVECTVSTIVLTCRVVDDVMTSYVDMLRQDIYEFVNSMGWSISNFVSFEDDSEIIRIVITQDDRKNFIPKSAISMINLNVDKYFEDTGFVSNKIAKVNNKCLCVIPCKPDHTYTVFVDATTCKVATSDTSINGEFNDITTVMNLSTITLLPSTADYTPKICYKQIKTSSVTQTILVETAYINAYPSIWVLDITNYPQTAVEKYTDTLKYPLFAQAWSINTKFFDYLFGMAITEYSDDLNISYIQEILNKLYPGYIIKANGVWSDLMTALIRSYQLTNGIIFSIGRIDAETESLMLKDVEDSKTYVGGVL